MPTSLWREGFVQVDLAYSIVSSLSLESLDFVRWHLVHGADPNIKTRRSSAALYFARYEYILEVVKILIENLADVNDTVAAPSAVADSRKYHSVSAGRLDIAYSSVV